MAKKVHLSDFPPGERQLYCTTCAYESSGFCHEDSPYGCQSCRAVVFPLPLPFVFAPPPCDQCGRQLTRCDRIAASHMLGDEVALCPCCEGQTLRLRRFQIQLLSGYLGDSIPEPGQLLHGRTRQPEGANEPFVFIPPRIPLKLLINVSVANRERDSIPNGYHEFRTVSAANDKLIVDYVRELPEDEWRWYFG